MDTKSALVKSKSSNSAISKKSKEGIRKQPNKKTRSNANFPPHGLKKRGVYVEKRLTKLNLVNNDQFDSATHKCTTVSIPRKGPKTFLDSVLTILSKSTTGTQYPEFHDGTKQCDDCERDTGHMKGKYCNDDKKTVDKSNVTNNTKGKKFKSRVLGKKNLIEDKKKMLVLQSKKEIVQTPSNYSEWSYKDASQKSTSNYFLHDDSYLSGEGINIADELKNALLEGRNLKVKKLRYLEDEPKTLVSDTPKVQKNLYNFFVDLLETTISVYNVKTEYDATAPSDGSQTNLQINESVANKLTINRDKILDEYEDDYINQQEPYSIHNETDDEENIFRRNLKPFKRDILIKTPNITKLKANSFVRSNKIMPQKSKSVEISRKKMIKNKNDLINSLKQELEIDTHRFEEPRSIFQALKVMARNKKKISFEPSIDEKNLTDECVLKRRKVISSRRFRKNRMNNLNKDDKVPRTDKMRFIDSLSNQLPKKKHTEKLKRDYNETEGSVSHHSIEVYGYDYEMNPANNFYKKPKEVRLTYHSSTSNTELDFDLQDALLNTRSTLSSIKKFSSIF